MLCMAEEATVDRQTLWTSTQVRAKHELSKQKVRIFGTIQILAPFSHHEGGMDCDLILRAYSSTENHFMPPITISGSPSQEFSLAIR